MNSLFQESVKKFVRFFDLYNFKEISAYSHLILYLVPRSVISSVLLELFTQRCSATTFLPFGTRCIFIVQTFPPTHFLQLYFFPPDSITNMASNRWWEGIWTHKKLYTFLKLGTLNCNRMPGREGYAKKYKILLQLSLVNLRTNHVKSDKEEKVGMKKERWNNCRWITRIFLNVRIRMKLQTHLAHIQGEALFLLFPYYVSIKGRRFFDMKRLGFYIMLKEKVFQSC